MKRWFGVRIPIPGVDDYWKIVISETAERDREASLLGAMPGIQGPVENILADNFGETRQNNHKACNGK
jgi:hypothetical protein